MNNIPIMPQLLGLIVIIICAITPQLKTKTSMIGCHLIANVLIIFQYWMLGATGRALLACFTVIRHLVFIRYSVKDKTAPCWTMCVFILISVGCIMLTFNRHADLFLLGSIVNIYGMWQKRLNVMRWCLLITVLSLGTYSLFYTAYTGALNEFIQAGSVLIAL
jgi:hypothetical protein